MDVIEATYRVNTPMFLGSANNEIAEIRPTSIVGVLRFWYRALALAEFNGNPKKVENAEGVIFGYTRGETATKALYSLRVANNNAKGQGKGDKVEMAGLSYLGYGLHRFDGKKDANIYNRNYISSDREIGLKLIKNPGLKTNLDEADLKIATEILLDSLKCLGIFGGLGSRSRKGFGSVTLLSLEHNGKPLIVSPLGKTKDALEAEIAKLLEKAWNYGNGNPKNIPYTAFSKHTKVVITKEYDASEKLLDEIGKEMLRYRGWGKGGKLITGETSLKLFKEDHDLVRLCENSLKGFHNLAKYDRI